MSTKPHPVALTAAALAARNPNIPLAAHLASALHRIAKACQRLAVAECNGEWRDGQRDNLSRLIGSHNVELNNRAVQQVKDLDDNIAAAGVRLDRRIDKMNAELCHFQVNAVRRGDPRGATLVLVEQSKRATTPKLPSNGWGEDYVIG